MNPNPTRIFLASLLAALLTGAALAGAAGAAPAWFFNGVELEGTEKVLGDAGSNNRVTVPGLTTDCGGSLLMTISNNAEEVGEGELTDLPLEDCYTSSPYCTVDAIEAQGLPWPSNVTTVEGGNYVVLEEVEVDVLYGGELCVLNEVLVTFEGSAGGLYDNPSETIRFDAESFEATETQLKALSEAAEWTGTFSMEATGARKGQALTIK